MLTKTITSVQHEKVAHLLLLSEKRAYREETQRVLIVGKKQIEELAEKFPIHSLVYIENPLNVKAQEFYQVTEAIIKKITHLPSPDGYAAEFILPKPQEVLGLPFVLVLDGVQDPGNLGTLLRSAVAFGWDGVVFTPGTVDPFNNKALRAGKGAIFHLPYQWLEEDQIIKLAQSKKISLLIADMEGASLKQIHPQPPLALILSHEGQGAKTWKGPMSHKIKIPMESIMESLNVSVAGGILLYHLKRSSP
jgi:TrmH family RNA methyltransferase